MTYSNTEAVNDNFQSIKTEGGRRTQNIADIFKAAVSEAVTEVKEGTTTVRPLAKDLADNAVQVIKEKGQEAYENASKAAKETAVDEKDIIAQLKLKLQAIVDAIKATLFTKQQPQEPTTTVLIEPETEVHTVVTADVTADVA